MARRGSHRERPARQGHKSEDGIRSIAISPTLAEELWQLRRRSNFQGDDERVFCHPTRGTEYRVDAFKSHLNDALAAAGIKATMRPFHDLRHTAITNDAAAGASPVAIMTKAGHANMATTKVYLHLAGVVFRDEANALEARVLGTQVGTHMREPQTMRRHLPGSTTRERDVTDPSSAKEFFPAEGDTAPPQVAFTPAT